MYISKVQVTHLSVHNLGEQAVSGAKIPKTVSSY